MHLGNGQSVPVCAQEGVTCSKAAVVSEAVSMESLVIPPRARGFGSRKNLPLKEASTAPRGRRDPCNPASIRFAKPSLANASPAEASAKRDQCGPHSRPAQGGWRNGPEATGLSKNAAAQESRNSAENGVSACARR
jgi:hypothetical protein